MSDAVLVLGSGLTGLRAAVDVAAAGSRAIIVERRPILGGKRAALLHAQDCPDPGLAEALEAPGIEYHTLAELVALDGEAGQFTATVQAKPRYVTADCTRCNRCVPVCPQVVANEYDAGLTYRKAIHSPLPQTVPDIYSINVDACLNGPPNYLPCQRCADACDVEAIHFDMPVPAPAQLDVASVILATGHAEDAERELLAEFGYGSDPDIVSAAELARLLEDPGPSGGFALRPSDEGYPSSVLMVLTVLSEDVLDALAQHLQHLAAQDIESLSVLALCAGDDPALPGLEESARAHGASLYQGAWLGVEKTDDSVLTVSVSELPRGSKRELPAELVVLYSEVRPDPTALALADTLGLGRNSNGFIDTACPGIYLAGGVCGTAGLSAGRVEASAAAQAALQHVEVDQETDVDQGAAAHASQLRREDIEQLLHALLRLGEGKAG